MFNNEQEITKIVMSGISHNFCPLGNAHYTNNFTMDFYPDEIIPDYLEVEKFIKDNIDEKDLIIEDCVNILFNYLRDTFKPKGLKVVSFVNDASHPKVTVEKGKDFRNA